jgi:hypothetical protein
VQLEAATRVVIVAETAWANDVLDALEAGAASW